MTIGEALEVPEKRVVYQRSSDGMETEHLLLTKWSSSEHVDDFARMVADPRVMKYISRGRPLTRDEAESISNRSAALWKQYGIGPWAAFEKGSGNWVGRIGLNLLADWPGPHKWEAWSGDPADVVWYATGRRSVFDNQH